MPFFVPWTDGIGKPGFVDGLRRVPPPAARELDARRRWHLLLGVVGRRPGDGRRRGSRRKDFAADADGRDRLVARAALPAPRLRDRDARRGARAAASAASAARRDVGRARRERRPRSGSPEKLGYVRSRARASPRRAACRCASGTSGSSATSWAARDRIAGRDRRRSSRACRSSASAAGPVASGAWPRRFSEGRRSSSRSTRSPTARERPARASRGSAASSCSCAAGCRATRCARG